MRLLSEVLEVNTANFASFEELRSAVSIVNEAVNASLGLPGLDEGFPLGILSLFTGLSLMVRLDVGGLQGLLLGNGRLLASLFLSLSIGLGGFGGLSNSVIGGRLQSLAALLLGELDCLLLDLCLLLGTLLRVQLGLDGRLDRAFKGLFTLVVESSLGGSDALLVLLSMSPLLLEDSLGGSNALLMLLSMSPLLLEDSLGVVYALSMSLLVRLESDLVG